MTIAFWRVSPTVSHRVQKRGLKSHSPATWDDAVKHSAALMSHMARPSQHANEGRIPETLLRGDTDDVSACVESGRRWPVWSWRPEALSPDHRVLARWLGPSSDIGVALTCGLATKEASPIGRSTAQPVTGEESREPGVTGGGGEAVDDKTKGKSDCHAQSEYEDTGHEDDEGVQYYDSLPAHGPHEDEGQPSPTQPGADDIDWGGSQSSRVAESVRRPHSV